MSWNRLPVPPALSWRRAVPVLLASLALVPCAAWAQDPAEPPPTPTPAPVEPSPAPPVTPSDPADAPARRKGWDFQGVPILNFNTDEGFGYGALAMLIDRADGTYEPYRYSVLLQFFQTTRQVASHLLNIDAPRFLESQWRMGLDLGYIRTRYSPYYGLGNTAERIPEWATCDDRDALEANPDVCPGNPEFRGLRYYTYDQRTLPRVRLNARRELADDWVLFLGYRLRMERLGLRYSADDLGQSGDSKILEDAAAGVFDIYPGGLSNPLTERTSELTAGIQYDTRDVESGPTLGMFHELSLRGGAAPIGSQFNYWGATMHARFFHPVVPGYRRLVASWRGLLDVMGGEVPISLLPLYGGLDGKDGHGGVYSARGILLRRYQGPVKLLLNGELRWTPLSIEPLGQQFDFTLAGFVDSGRVWSDLKFSEGGGFKTSAGGGLRIAWNREFVIRLDYGVGITEPTTGFYLDFGHMF
ncbi:Omp85 family outer membrane protein [Hyalangium rubrum]|uniref:BamA/TamA family outer membrane protein n=1 Tax=Hyalangium rubrum TaxID=3103134 RepID=A0ABU5GWQ5_9BACT|nr:BamA/TamA family outer membrane protein [Hyalangium sp. s54d21]MDY7225618.1 BamA/TamA family outer membrane protein [Hyalangium sp. s54d21]